MAIFPLSLLYFDDNKSSLYFKEDDTYFNRSRITAVMDMGHSVWVGTGEGNLIVYEIAEHINFKTPTDASPSIETPSSLSGKLFLAPTPSPRNSSLSSRSKRRNERERSRSKSPRDKSDKPLFLVGIEDSSGKCIDRVDKKPLKRSLSSEISASQLQNKTLEVSRSDTGSNGTNGTVTPKNRSPKLIHLEKTQAIEKAVLEERDSSTESYDQERRHSHDSVIEVRKVSDDLQKKESSDDEEKKDDLNNTANQENEISENKEKLVVNENEANKNQNEAEQVTDVAQLPRPTDLKLKVNNRKNWLQSQKGKGHSFVDELDIALSQLNGVIEKAKTRNGYVQGQGQGSSDLDGKLEKQDTVIEAKPHGQGKEQNVGQGKDEKIEPKSLNNIDLNYEIKEISRHHKVNTWLSSLEEAEKPEEISRDSSLEHDDGSLNESGFSDSSVVPESENIETPSEENVKENSLVKSKTEKKEFPKRASIKSDTSNRNVINSPVAMNRARSISSDSTNSSNGKHPRLRMKRLSERMIAYNNRQKTLVRDESVDSEMTTAPAAKVDSHDPEVQYRLDFSGVYIETDSEMDQARQSRSDSISEYSMAESRRQSAMEEPFQPALDHLFMMELNQLDNWTNSASNSVVTTPADSSKMLELMQTPSLMSRHISVNKVSRNRQDWNDVSSNQMSSTSARSSMDFNKVQEFLRTPSISSKASSVWSSYDEISTPSVKDDEIDVDGFGRRIQTLSGLITHTSSHSSLCSMVDSLYTVDVTLQAKVKISDKPVRSFVKTR